MTTASVEQMVSPMTGEQVNVLARGFRKQVARRAKGTSSHAAQIVLRNRVMWLTLSDVFFDIVERAKEMLLFDVEVDRDAPPEEMLTAIGRVISSWPPVVASMPRGGKGGRLETILLPVDRFAFDSRSSLEAVLGGKLKDVVEDPSCYALGDPYTLAEINRLRPELASVYPNATVWWSEAGRRTDGMCHEFFDVCQGDQVVTVRDGQPPLLDKIWVPVTRSRFGDWSREFKL